jgi:hypothetical protein
MALDPGNWPAAAGPFTTLVSTCLDPRPKVRKKAAAGLVEVLAALQHTTALPAASAIMLKGALLPCMSFLVGLDMQPSNQTAADAI